MKKVYLVMERVSCHEDDGGCRVQIFSSKKSAEQHCKMLNQLDRAQKMTNIIRFNSFANVSQMSDKQLSWFDASKSGIMGFGAVYYIEEVDFEE